MVATSQKVKAPYSRPTPVLAVLRRNHDKGVPEPVNAASLERIGIVTTTAPHTLQTLRFLDFVNKDGERTEVFERMQRVGDDEYRAMLAESLHTAYKPVFDIVDPATNDRKAIDDAFRVYEPAAMRDRMVLLFLGLCEEAGIIPPEANKPKPRTNTATKPNRAHSQTNRKKEQPPPLSTQQDMFQFTSGQTDSADYSMLAALFRKLPRNGKWTEREQERWMQALDITLSMSVEVVSEDE